MINSTTMKLTLPGRKINAIQTETRYLLSNPTCLTRQLSCLIGELNATSPALQIAPLFCCSLQTSLGTQCSKLPVNTSVVPGGHRGCAMLEPSSDHMEGQKPNLTDSFHGDRDRCLSQRLWSHMRWLNKDQRSLVPSGARASYQLPRTARCNPGLPKTKQICKFC